METILSIIGTHLEIIKLVPVILALQEKLAYHSVVCATAQYHKMLDQVIKPFALQIGHDLNIMSPANFGASHRPGRGGP